MRTLIAFDKFKDALSARAACETVASALRSRHPDWLLDLCPLTDGGDGFTETLCNAHGERIESMVVHGPRDRQRIDAPLGFVSSWALTPAARQRIARDNPAEIAVLGLASASGLALLPHDRRDPWHTTTFGTGELLGYCAHKKAEVILLGIGGSATNDLGFGALAALGCKFLDAGGAIIPVPTPSTWERICRIDVSATIKLPPLLLACDVSNPLLGPTGATATFGPQKGLMPDDRPRLEAQMKRMAALLCQACDQPLALAETPGAGAAGGIALGLMVALGAKLVPGFDLASDWLDLPARIAAADLIITGEGRFDAPSLSGKGPGSLIRAAQQCGKPVHVFAGTVALPEQETLPLAGVKFHAITPAEMDLRAALPRTQEFLTTVIDRIL